MKKIVVVFFCVLLMAGISYSVYACNNSSDSETDKSGEKAIPKLAEQNVLRAMAIVDSTITHYFSENAMARYYNPYTNERSEEKGSVWMYSSSIEAVNAILHALEKHKEHGNAGFYQKYFNRYVEVLDKLYKDADYYEGTFTLTSYTQTKEWTVYGVDRGREKGAARVEGIYNVYDDQQWLVRELLESYKLTGNKNYLEKAEYLTEYVLDGWDSTLDQSGNENGGITWGPGYTTKHSCSNGPMVSPLVWLHELYKDKNDEITYKFIDKDQNRKTSSMKKSDYYLKFAKAVYKWQKDNLLLADGVYADMMGGCDPNCDIAYETIGGEKYRKHTGLRRAEGRAYSYNCGTMISGAADLYRTTKDRVYQEDAKELSEASFKYFAKLNETVEGYYTYSTDGFNNWFNGVLMRGFVDVYPAYKSVAGSIDSFQKNLDYGYNKYLYKGFLPTDLLKGWDSNTENNKIEGMFLFTFAAEYAVLARYELVKSN